MPAVGVFLSGKSASTLNQVGIKRGVMGQELDTTDIY